MSEIRRSTGSRSSVLDRRLPGRGQQHFVSFAAQDDPQQLAHRSLVVDDEDAGRRTVGDRIGHPGHLVASGRDAGSRTETVVPRPGCELTAISP